MASVRISGNLHNIHTMEWLGAPTVDDNGHVERTVELPEVAYQRIESGIASGYLEGIVYLGGGLRFNWYVDRPRPRHPRPQEFDPAI